jgi:hypothetical protein
MKPYENQAIHPPLRCGRLGGGCNDLSNYTSYRDRLSRLRLSTTAISLLKPSTAETPRNWDASQGPQNSSSTSVT